MIVPSFKQKGPIIVAGLIAKGIRKIDKSHDFVFVSLRKNDEEDSAWLTNSLDNGVKYYELGMGKLPTKRVLTDIIQIAKNEKIDILHSHSYWPTVITAKVNEIKKIITVHEETKTSLEYDYGVIIAQMFIKKFLGSLRKYQKTVFVSETVRNHILSLQKYEENLKDCDVILNGVEDSYRKPTVPNEINNKTVAFASFSVLNKRKNIILALKAFTNLKRQHIKSFKYDIYGSGPELNDLIEYSERNDLAENINFKGMIARNEVLRAIPNYDVVIMPSLSEGLSLAAIEAQMLAKPLICSDIASFKEIITEGYNGLLFSNNDVEDLVRKLVFITRNRSLINELSFNSRNRYLQKFELGVTARRYLNVYLQVQSEKN